MTFREFFRRLDGLEWDHVVYFPRPRWTLESECVVLDDVDLGPEEVVNPEASRRGMVARLGITVVRDVQENAKAQGRRPTDEEMLAALTYYFAHDGYLDFGRLDNAS